MTTVSPTRSVKTQRWFEAVAMLFIAALSYSLLSYIGYGESLRIFPRFEAEKLIAQGETIRLGLDEYLEAGLPLHAYPGFKPASDRLLASDPTIAAITVFGLEGQTIFANGSDTVALLRGAVLAKFPEAEFRGNHQYYQVSLPLRSKFAVEGTLTVTMLRTLSDDRIAAAMAGLPLIVAAASVFMGGLAYFLSALPPARMRRWLQAAYAASFIAVAAVLLSAMMTLYTEGAKAKAHALADSLGERLAAIPALGLGFDELEGIGQVFEDYHRLNPDLGGIGLLRGESAIVSSTGASAIPTSSAASTSPSAPTWQPDPNDYEFSVGLDQKPGAEHASLHLSLPRAVVYQTVGESGKNFAVLFVASAFIANLLFRLSGALRSLLFGGKPAGQDPQLALEIVAPIMFVGFFVENMATSFLPQLMQQSAATAGLSPSVASLMFMTYFLCFAGSLLPAGAIADRIGGKPLIILGAVITLLGSLILATSDHYLMLTLGRIAGGIGQGTLFIGVQSYILSNAQSQKRTEAAGIVVYAFNGGMLCGMVIGSLLVNYISASGVFLVSAGIIGLAACFAFLALPSGQRQSIPPQPDFAPAESIPIRRREQLPLFSLLRAFQAVDFVKAILLVGIPAKAVLTGIIIFAMPLLLSGMHLPAEDIGQVMMFYALGVVIASAYATRLADRIGETNRILFWGTAVSGIGLMLVGASGWKFGTGLTPAEGLLLILIGVTIIGLAHGFINAPVITHIATSSAATELGEIPVSALYRFVERIGHISGPLIIGQLFYFGGQGPAVLAWVGMALIICAALFIFPSRRLTAAD